MNWQEALQKHYDGLAEAQQLWVREHVDRDGPLLIEMERPELIDRFCHGDELQHTHVMRTLIWQTLGRILSGERERFTGNLRTFWYEESQPLYNRNDLFDRVSKKPGKGRFHVNVPRWLQLIHDLREPDRKLTAKESYINTMGENVFQEFVSHKIFRYQDFGFKDKTAHLKLLGSGHASLVFFVEKEGLFDKYCRRYHEEYKISVVASNGEPSAIGLEYFSDQLRGKKIKNVGLAGLVDYDPFGYDIFDTYVSFFQTEGFGIKDATLVTSLDLFTAKALAEESVDLVAGYPKKKTQVKNWFAKTGGINGEKRGIHADAASSPRVHKKVDQWYQQQTDRIAKDGGKND